jgi:Tfp pilus assembly protein PilX
MIHHSNRPPRQTGVVLITTLVLLIVVTLVVLGSLRNSTIGMRMVGNLADRNVAFQSSDVGIRYAELLVDANKDNPGGWVDYVTGPPTSCVTSNGLCRGAPADFWATSGLTGSSRVAYGWANAFSVAVGGTQAGGKDSAGVARFYANWRTDISRNVAGQELGSEANANVFTVVARGVGRSADSFVMTEETLTIPKPFKQ